MAAPTGVPEANHTLDELKQLFGKIQLKVNDDRDLNKSSVKYGPNRGDYIQLSMWMGFVRKDLADWAQTVPDQEKLNLRYIQTQTILNNLPRFGGRRRNTKRRKTKRRKTKRRAGRK